MTFETFYSLYPRRINKSLAKKKYDAAIKRGIPHETLINSSIEYSKWVERTRTESQFVCHPATWIGQERYLNDYATMDTEPTTKGIHAKPKGRGLAALEASADKILSETGMDWA